MSSEQSHQDLRGVAEAYWEEGYVIIPFCFGTDNKGETTKKPNIAEWKELQTRPQTREEFDALREKLRKDAPERFKRLFEGENAV